MTQENINKKMEENINYRINQIKKHKTKEK